MVVPGAKSIDALASWLQSPALATRVPHTVAEWWQSWQNARLTALKDWGAIWRPSVAAHADLQRTS